MKEESEVKSEETKVVKVKKEAKKKVKTDSKEKEEGIKNGQDQE